MATISPYLDAVREELLARTSLSFAPDRDLPRAPARHAEASSGPRILFVGFPSDYSLAFLLGLLQLDVHVCGIVTSPGAHPAILGDNALSRIADHLGVPLLRTWRINDDHSRIDLAALRPEAAVMASFNQIVNAPTLRIPHHGFINIHPSRLPDYRGPEPVYWVIADGAEVTGISLHRAVPKVDAGPILADAAGPKCVDVDLTGYDVSCATAGDCMNILSGTVCDGACECRGANIVGVSMTNQSQYAATLSGISLSQCHCLGPSPAQCIAGQCVNCDTPNALCGDGDAGHSKTPDAGP